MKEFVQQLSKGFRLVMVQIMAAVIDPGVFCMGKAGFAFLEAVWVLGE